MQNCRNERLAALRYRFRGSWKHSAELRQRASPESVMPPCLRLSGRPLPLHFRRLPSAWRRTNGGCGLLRHGDVRAPALPATASFRRHGFRFMFNVLSERNLQKVLYLSEPYIGWFLPTEPQL
jgi:hypothetical protein